MNQKSDLQKIPGIGISISHDLQNIGIRRIDDLVGKNPEALYDLSNQYAGYIQDRCLLYVFSRSGIFRWRWPRHRKIKVVELER